MFVSMYHMYLSFSCWIWISIAMILDRISYLDLMNDLDDLLFK